MNLTITTGRALPGSLFEPRSPSESDSGQLAACGPKANHLLAALSEADSGRWLAEIEWVDLPLGQVLYESGASHTHLYFPTTAIVSVLYVMESGAPAEIAVVGNEGAVGISLFMGSESTPSQAIVQSAGQGYRLKAPFVKEEFSRSGPAMHLLLRYTQALITQIAQTAACNRHHSIDQRLCRWVLLRLDRLQSSELAMTQEQIAHLLGVRREGVTEAALKLQKDGVIRYCRGRIAVLDRKGLELRACECYAVVKKECGRLLPEMTAISEPNDAGKAAIFCAQPSQSTAAKHLQRHEVVDRRTDVSKGSIDRFSGMATAIDFRPRGRGDQE